MKFLHPFSIFLFCFIASWAHLAHAGVVVGVEASPVTVLEDNGVINVGSPSNPIEISLNPDDPTKSWMKTFMIDGGIATGTQFTVNEWIRINPPPVSSGLPNLSLTDWHESIIGPSGFTWGSSSQLDLLSNTPVIMVLGTRSTDNKDIWFDFASTPATPPTDIKITKSLVYNGPTSTSGVQVQIAEIATVPECSSFLLVGFCAAFWTWKHIRRRRRSSIS